MSIVQCKFCRNPFQSMKGRICPDCLDQIERDYTEIRRYLYDHPNVSGVEELATETGISEAVIIHLVNENRLFAKDISDDGAYCQVCRKPISSGTICDNCGKLLAAGLAKEKPEEKKATPAARMHIRRDN